MSVSKTVDPKNGVEGRTRYFFTRLNPTKNSIFNKKAEIIVETKKKVKNKTGYTVDD